MHFTMSTKKTLTYFGRGSITVQLTTCLTGQDSAALVMLNQIEIYNFGQIQTSQTGGQLYSDTSPYEVSECSLYKVSTDQWNYTIPRRVNAGWFESKFDKNQVVIIQTI